MSGQTQPSHFILFVDDDEMSRTLFARATRGLYPVRLAQGAQEAMAILERHAAETAIVVTDFRMPGCNGDDLLREIAGKYPHIVRILVTAYADKDLLLNAVNTDNAFRIIEKPLRMEAVNEVLSLALAHFNEREARHQRLLAMDETLAFLAHELNTPLATIALHARAIGEDQPTESDAERHARFAGAASSMLNNAQYCLSLIESFWSTIKDGGHRPSSATGGHEVRATRLVAGLIETYPFSGSQRDWIQVDIQGDFVVSAMPNCVALVLSSLVSNALRALSGNSGTSAPFLRIEVVARPRPAIRVCDNGPGIAPDIKARLAHDVVTTHAGNGGHGMGTIFCNRIMQSVGGSLLIDSTVGAGTTVTMDFGNARNRVRAIDEPDALADHSARGTLS
ncbi:hybrid sensor histidine kinase/response regulator [Paraburkholderia sp. J67]|uniref:hybrid sensor histidine kinase/response regulator n=1 Tax=Paraburkholderia sp. J67 TaxID=2805435 RepID=UPI002ABE1160|nr:hybrid sensor histidine kinase/response regulator [Paraburkholderia sp. J67]